MDSFYLQANRFYVNKCENYDPAPLELVTNILNRKLSIFRSFPGRISHSLYGLNTIVLSLNKAIGYRVIKVIQYLLSPVV